jgi:hypothetical protein
VDYLPIAKKADPFGAYKMYEKPIGPSQIKTSRIYHKYSEPIGPKPLYRVYKLEKGETYPENYVKKIIDQEIKAGRPELANKIKKWFDENSITKHRDYYRRSRVLKLDTQPFNMYDKPIGPIKPK